MATSQGKEVAYESIQSLGKEHSKFAFIDDFESSSWTTKDSKNSMVLTEKVSYPLFPDSEDFMDEGYDSGDDQCAVVSRNGQPEVNLRNVMSGMFAILMGRNRNHSVVVNVPELPSSSVSFLGSAKNGETFLHSSVYTPSAPPLYEPNALNYNACKEVLESEPPEWLPDSSTTSCMQCNAPFKALTRGRHHCRFCGGIFCWACSKGRCLLPAKFRERNPQRVCDTCYDRLDPLQGLFTNTISNAAQVAKHDVMDWSCSRAWLNLPIGMSMEYEIFKSANMLRSYCQVARLDPEKSIPASVLKGARGLAMLTVAKAGMVLAYKLGSGLVLSRREDGSWSAPSAILSFGLGWGAQVGGELMDFIIVLHNTKAVETFSSRMHFSLGAGLSAAAGPIGRVAEADLRAGDKGSGMCYTYSCSKGAFIGVSLEGNIVSTRMDTNLRFYGDPYLTTSDILLGSIQSPKAAEPLYAAIREVYQKLRC